MKAGILFEKNSNAKIVRDKNGRFCKGTHYSHWKGKKYTAEHKKNIQTSVIESYKHKSKLIGSKKICPICGVEIIYVDRFTFIQHMDIFHNPMKNPEIVKRADPASHFKETNKNFKKGIYPKNWVESRNKGFEKHDNAITEEMRKFESQGFRVIPVGRRKDIEPDFIVIKDNKVFAVEVELSDPNYEKYSNVKYFDDIIWILKEQASSRVKSCVAYTGASNSDAKHG